MSSICDDLRAAILQAAMQGKLTEQLPEDGDVKELFNQATGIMLPTILEEETPFSVPQSWEWVKLKTIASIQTGHKDANYGTKDGEYPFYTCSKDPINAPSYSFDGDYLVLPGNGANVGLSIHYMGKFEAYQRTYVVGLLNETYQVNMDYLQIAMQWNWKQYNADKMYGSAIPYIKLGNLQNYIFPLPPLAEQKRIVEKVDELMARVADLEKSADALASLKKSFPDDIKASLLQAAMQGKLTEQLPEDGTAEELLNRIHEQKKTTNKKIRPLIDSDELFMIPNTWAWTKLGEIIDFDIGKTPPRADTSYWGTDIPWVSIADMPKNGILLSTKEKVSNKALKEKFNSKIVPKGTLLMSFKLTVGRCSILGIDAVHNEAIISMRPVVDDDFILRDYLAKVLPILSNYGETKDAIKGKTLNSDSLNNLPIPLPPLAEQKRIIERLDSLMQNIEVISQLIMGE